VSFDITNQILFLHLPDNEENGGSMRQCIPILRVKESL
jgi:hypothetical protein